MKAVKCALDHRMIEVVPGLMLCECSSYGPKSNLKGMVAEARALVARHYGGMGQLRDRIEKAEAEAREKRAEAAAEAKAAPIMRPVRDA